MPNTFNNISITVATEEDLDEIRKLFFETINSINIKDYNEHQVAIWASTAHNSEMWRERLEEQYFICARLDKEIVGFGSLTTIGYIDFMFVHKNYQRQGIASALLSALIIHANTQKNTKVFAEVSITAKPFFERNGFCEEKKNSKILKGVEFINYEMIKFL